MISFELYETRGISYEYEKVLTTKSRAFGSWSVFCIFPGAMIALTEDVNFFQTNGFYCITVLVFVFIIYLLIDFMKKRAYDKRLANLLESEEMEFVVSLPKPQTYEEELYTKLLFRLKANAEKVLLTFEEQKEEDMVQKTICYSQLNDFSKDCQISDVSLRRVVNHCMRSEYSNIQNKDIHVKMENLDFVVNSDEKWLAFIVKQILDNAVKYSKAHGEISIYGINEHYDQRLVIRDYGVGICTEDIRRVFDKGYTGANGRKKITSTGVGLYLSHKLAKKLGHEIRINSTPGKGTIVEIVIQA